MWIIPIETLIVTISTWVILGWTFKEVDDERDNI